MQRGDSRFQVILAQFVPHRRFSQEMESSPDQIAVPPGTVLCFQLDQTAIVVHATGKTGRVETEERQQGMGPGLGPLRVLAEEKRQTDRLETKVLPHRPFGAAAVVTLVEQKVDRLMNRREARGDIRSVRELHERPREPEEFPRPAEPLFDGLLAGQEGVGDLGNAETAKRLENQRHLDFGRELRMTAGKHHAQLVVADLLLEGGRVPGTILPESQTVDELRAEVAELIVPSQKVDGPEKRPPS